jgi:hypothetical protein
MTDEDRAKIQLIMAETAQQVLQQEQLTPGQDPELIQWAKQKLAGVDTPLPASAPQAAQDAMTGYQPVPQPPVPSQPPLPPAAPAQPSEPEVAEDGSEGVLHIQQTPGETIRPTQGGTASNDTQDNGERNGNSN